MDHHVHKEPKWVVKMSTRVSSKMKETARGAEFKEMSDRMVETLCKISSEEMSVDQLSMMGGVYGVKVLARSVQYVQ